MGFLGIGAAFKPHHIILAHPFNVSVHGLKEARPEPERPRRVHNRQPARHPWAELLQRVFAVDIMTCPRCLSAMRFGKDHQRDQRQHLDVQAA
jgi:hypothetical protein